MAFFHPKSALDKAFEVSILIKAFDGLVEIASGLFLLVVRPEQVSRWVQYLTAPELSHDPHDFFATHIVHWSGTFTKGAAVFAALYLLSHGLVKVVLVFSILRGHLWAYPGLIIVTVGFIAYQLFHIFTYQPTFGYIALTIFDVVVVYLTVVEYSKQRVVFAKRRENVDNTSQTAD